MKKSYNNIGYYFQEGFHAIFTHGLMSFAAVFMIVACLIIMGSFSLLAVNVGAKLGDLERDNQFLAFVDESYTKEETEALQKKIEQVDNVSSVSFTSKEEAKNSYIARYASDKNAGLYQDLPPEVFRDRFAVHMTDIGSLDETVAAVESLEGIDGHQAAPEISEGLVLVSNVASTVALALILLLLIISNFIIYNTIKIGTFARREEIAIMKMCGATNGFVRGPFIMEGMLLGLFGALIAFFCQWGIYAAIARLMDTGETVQMLTILPFVSLAPPLLLTFVLTGLIVGTVGSLLAIRKFLQI